ncbi:MAG: hypothetical protein ACREA9_21500 [Pyrinomonadaceae bacterium]
MQVSDIRNPAERNKLILAGVLGIIAVLFLWWTFFGFGSSSNKVASGPAGQPTPSVNNRGAATKASTPAVVDVKGIDPEELRPVVYHPPLSAPEAGRNIFVYFEKPLKLLAGPATPTPTATPTPPVLLASLSPANVYARTGEFTLEISGDKITQQLRVVVDTNELPTRYISPQQLSTTVPAALIASPGGRQVVLRSADGKLYSNTSTLSVAEPPKPNYTYIGIIGTVHHIDTAILQDKNNKETLNVQRGDLLGGRFRVTSISEKEVVLIDSNLKIKHTLGMLTQGDRSNPLQRPTPKVESEDDEP